MARTPRTARKGAGHTRGTRPAWTDRFLAELREVGTIAAAARIVQVGRRTVYDELERNPDFAEQVREIRGECLELVESTLYQLALDPDHTTDRIFYLKTAAPERYGDKLRQDQIDQIRREARSEAIRELEGEIARLPEGPRQIVLDALSRTARELPA